MTAPALSSTLARVLLNQSPAHAWWNCRDLNPAYREEHKQEYDLGTAAHALLLEGKVEKFVVVDALDWKTKDAQTKRAAAWADGKTPLLAGQYANLVALATAALTQIEHFGELPKPLTLGTPEVTLDWIEAGVHCRTRCDWLHADRLTVDDLKTTSGSAHPDVWGRSIWNSGYDIQAAFYLRGIKACHGTDATFRFVVVELAPPYGLSVIGLEPEALALADRKVDRALALWRECNETGQWPGYPKRVAYPEMPAWERAKGEVIGFQPDWTVAFHPDGSGGYTAAVRGDGRPIDEQLFGDKP